MLKIGDFSKLSRVSIRMLRYYDEIGLLTPAVVDSFTGYRYYREEQLYQIGRITSLKDMGFSLMEIHDILRFFGEKSKMEQCLRERREELQRQAEQTAYRIRLLDTAIERLGKENYQMKYDVTVKKLPERYAACVRMTIPCYEDEGMVWKILTEETGGMNLVPAEPCFCSVTFFDGEYKEKDVDVEAQKPVKGHYPDTEHVKFRTLPEVTFASAIHKGPYETIGDIYAEIVTWIRDNGYEFDGPMFNIYHVSPAETSNPEEFVTEACYPVKKRGT